ncbi:TPA: phage filamentation protein Fil family protein [Citrobacter amalonaticus]
MKAFVTYLKKESPAMQLPSGSTGWIELPNGQRWNPGHTYKFNAHESGQSDASFLSGAVAGTDGRE